MSAFTVEQRVEMVAMMREVMSGLGAAHGENQGPAGGISSGEEAYGESDVVVSGVDAPSGSSESGVSVGVGSESESGVEMPEERGPSPEGLRFTCVDELRGDTRVKFFKDFVRVPRVAALSSFLKRMFNVSISDRGMPDLAMASYTVGVVPVAFKDGRKRLKGFESVGDAVMTLLLVEAEVKRGVSVSSVQELRSSLLSNSMLSRVFVKSGLVAHVAVAAGVDVEHSKVGADAIEVLAGLIHEYEGIRAVKRMMVKLGFIH